MKGVDRAELNHGIIIAYALVRALFEELGDSAKRPDPADGQPVDLMMWVEAHQRLKTLSAS
jgi:hypothetical protein